MTTDQEFETPSPSSPPDRSAELPPFSDGGNLPRGFWRRWSWLRWMWKEQGEYSSEAPGKVEADLKRFELSLRRTRMMLGVLAFTLAVGGVFWIAIEFVGWFDYVLYDVENLAISAYSMDAGRFRDLANLMKYRMIARGLVTASILAFAFVLLRSANTLTSVESEKPKDDGQIDDRISNVAAVGEKLIDLMDGLLKMISKRNGS